MQSKSVFSRPKKVAYFGGAGTLAVICLAGSGAILPVSAQAQDSFFYYREYRHPDPYYYPRDYRRRPEPAQRPAIRQSARPAPVKETVAAKQKDAPPPAGPHVLVVSLKSQRATLYANGRQVAQTPISSGKATNPTPTGVFSVIQKNRHHRSNIYSGAPMPYMQRLTWSGIALHQGALPGYAASHGCVRLPEQFANYLWRTTKLGARVVISREDTAPYDVAHAKLFQPKLMPNTVETTPPLRRTLDTTTQPLTRTAGIALVATDAVAEPTTDAVADAAPKPATQDTTAVAPATEELPSQEQITGSVNRPQADIPDAILDSFAQSLQAKQKKSSPNGPISVFISRKEKKLFVRQGFIPLFSAPVSFQDEKAIFGTHVLTAHDKGDDSRELRWTAVTLPAELPHVEKPKTTFRIDEFGRRVAVPARQTPKMDMKTADVQPVPSIASVLDRIDIPQDIAERVSEYITAGASLIISDHGLGRETGLHTDFIVETR